MQARTAYGDYSALDDRRSYAGVRTKRIFAFCLDYLIVALLLIPVSFLVVLLGIVTFGLGWMLFGVLAPVVTLAYVAATLGGRHQATTGMRMMGVRLVQLNGAPIGPMVAVMHTVLFWAGNVILSPVVLAVTLFADRKRTLHDLLLGTVVVRADA